MSDNFVDISKYCIECGKVVEDGKDSEFHDYKLFHSECYKKYEKKEKDKILVLLKGNYNDKNNR